MFTSIKNFFDEFIAVAPSSENISEQQLHIATAALLIEMMHMDDKILEQERNKIIDLAKTSLSLSSQQAEALISLAETELHQSTDYFQFTSLINKGFSEAQKIRLIKSLWEVAYVDGHLDENEEYMVRKTADLLHVPHVQLIKMKNLAGSALKPKNIS